MKIGVLGSGHLAITVGTCLDERGHAVTLCDDEPFITRPDQQWSHAAEGFSVPFGFLPIARLADKAPDLVWVCFDTPLTPDGTADLTAVLSRIVSLKDYIPPSVPIILSSQWPVGTTAQIAEHIPNSERLFYVPENIRVGKALADFRRQSRIVLGVASVKHEEFVVDLLAPFTSSIDVVSWKSAEMVKHALNAFLALNICFANEISRICHAVGADATDVMRALLREDRISPNAPLKPGAPFGGGSLQRDCRTLEDLIQQHDIWAPILRAILPSNARTKGTA